MFSEYQKFQLKRWWRRRIRKLSSLWQSTIYNYKNNIHAPILRKFIHVRRFVLGWVFIVVIMIAGIGIQTQQLDSAYKKTTPQQGGVYSEGIVGEPTNFNPIFASGNVNQAATRLMFGSLFEYDRNGQLNPDIAKNISLDEDGTSYTVEIRDDVFWHDGHKLDAKDVVYTFQTIQQPNTRSPLLDSWKDITIESTDKYKVKFTLPNKFAPFQHSLTTGIIPEHILKDLQLNELRTSGFNQAPIGTGPFQFRGLDADTGELEMIRSENYYKNPAFLNRFVIQTYEDNDALTEALVNGEITAAADIEKASLPKDSENQVLSMPLTNAVFSFFNTNRKPLNDKQLRKALSLAVDRDQLLKNAELDNAPIRSPLLVEQLGFDINKQQPGINIEKAKSILQKAGWKPGADGIRKKGRQRLSFTIASQSGDEFPAVSQYLQSSWKEMGVDVNVELLSLDELRKERIVPHDYDALLFGIALGSDPDIFAYWHSSQAKVGGFNLSEYDSQIADESLEAGRTRLDDKLRAAKYQTFTDEWLADTPAVALYRTNLIYYQSINVVGTKSRRLIDPADRFNDVENWAVSTEQNPRN